MTKHTTSSLVTSALRVIPKPCITHNYRQLNSKKVTNSMAGINRSVKGLSVARGRVLSPSHYPKVVPTKA